MSKEELITAVQNQVDELKQKFEELRGRAQVQAKLGQAEAREALQPVIKDVETKMNTAQKQLEQLRSASGDAAEDIIHGAHVAVKALQVAFDKAADKFKG